MALTQTAKCLAGTHTHAFKPSEVKLGGEIGFSAFYIWWISLLWLLNVRRSCVFDSATDTNIVFAIIMTLYEAKNIFITNIVEAALGAC